ncbi:GNAT family N-acetyltransferase [Granulicella sp. 5B5]|uniref:GNAT family N-acetyltransferase n=1 Tax=Granulicella sp. 5B5 TaxID=1617967 RepID=UPI0015F45716|nr:GNAT family N-acetyltransferase [Granulicella sp. 5B5]QMV17663.1 GNAT family N-acetyltransferase [Granulicella sp. 5B5]
MTTELKQAQAATQFALRPATFDDVPAILALVEASVRGLQANDYSPTQIDASIGSAFGVDRQLIADQTYFVATPVDDPATLIACGGWSYRSTLCGSDAMSETVCGTPRSASTLNPATDYAKIRAIFVHPAWARRGLGSLVLKHCEEAAQAAGYTRFEMGSTLTGLHLYSLKGYVECSRSSVPLPNGETLEIVLMQKSLPLQ